ncbi:MAG TPA: hypothetical protein VFI47_31140, partial [Acidimicrobiales bacterium]|nr:hypothetical protein [Acidimicrobiales bacterium]
LIWRSPAPPPCVPQVCQIRQEAQRIRGYRRLAPSVRPAPELVQLTHHVAERPLELIVRDDRPPCRWSSTDARR